MLLPIALLTPSTGAPFITSRMLMNVSGKLVAAAATMRAVEAILQPAISLNLQVTFGLFAFEMAPSINHQIPCRFYRLDSSQ